MMVAETQLREIHRTLNDGDRFGVVKCAGGWYWTFYRSDAGLDPFRSRYGGPYTCAANAIATAYWTLPVHVAAE